MTPPSEMALTAALVARVARIEPDPGPAPGIVSLVDADYDELVGALVAHRPPGDLWLFAYGSLIWKPELTFLERRRATVHGWHRSFCLRLTRWRGTRERPGLMMALDRGGRCDGIAYRLPAEDIEGQLHRLLRREMSTKPPTNCARWLAIRTAAGPMRAIGFAARRDGPGYGGPLPDAEVAHILARAAGHWGTGAEYLYQTIVHLEDFGIRDRHLWRLQEMVAKEIAALPA